MKAVVMTSGGGPDVLQMQDIPEPELQGTHEVLVRLRAAGVNPLDTKLRNKPAPYPLRAPVVLGCDGAGTVEAIGSSVQDFKVGDEVYFCQCGFGNRGGTYAQYTVVEERLLAKKPHSLHFVEAAALPLVAITAWEALYDRARLAAGQTALIHGGAGGVGHIAIQLAKQIGARVATTVSSEEKAAFAQGYGADKVIRYRQEDFVAAGLAWTDRRGVDCALDTVGADTFAQTFPVVRCYGDLVTLLQPSASVDWTLARQRNLRIGFELMLSPLLLALEQGQLRQGNILRECAQRIDGGKLTIHVDATLPLAQAADAHRHLESGQVKGKVILAID